MEKSELVYNYEVTNQLGLAITGGERGLRAVPGLLKKIIKEDLWQLRYIPDIKREVTFKRFADFVTTVPLEGLGVSRAILETICKAADDTEALSLLQEAFDDQQGRHTNTSSLHCKDDVLASQGNSAARAIRKLRKDRPDLHAQVIDKKLSPHAAMVEAGFRPKTITVPVDVEKAAKVLARNFKLEDIDKLIQALYDLME